MASLGRFTRQLRARLWKPSVEREVDTELAYHLEMRVAENVALGMDPAAARAAALRRFGDVHEITVTCRTLGKERDRTMRFRDWLAELRQDVRYAVRHLWSNPAFSAVAALTIALGVGTATTIFGVVNAVILRPLPFREPAALVRVWESNPTTDEFSVSEPNYLDWQARAHGFAEMGAWVGTRFSLLGSGEPERIRGAAVTPSLFRTLGVAPVVGRTFVDEEARPDAGRPVAVLGYALWQRRFGGDPRVLGRPVSLDGTTYDVVGVMPPGFDFPARRELWVPYAPSSVASRGNHVLGVAARLRPGVAPAQAAAEMRAIARDLARQYPASNADWGTTLRTFGDWVVTPELRTRVLVLLGAVGLLLLMSCVNVANLLLARASVRQRDVTLRASLGAGRGRLARQLLTESLVLASVGAALGIALSFAAVPVLRASAGDAVPRLDELRVDWRVLAFGVASAVATGLLFGLAPALQAARANAGTLLRGGARLVDAGRVRSALIVASVGLAMLLLVGAGLVGGSFVRLMRVDPGFRPDGVLTASITLPNERYPQDAQRIAFWREAVHRLGAIPGVTAAGATNIAPFSGGNTGIPFTVPGRDQKGFLQANWRSVTPSLFAALGVPLKRGRLVAESDTPDTPPVIVVSERMAQRVWPGQDPLGRQIRVEGGRTNLWTVVGVVGDVRDGALGDEPREMMYLAYQQVGWSAMWLVLRTPGDPARLADALRREVWAIDKTLPVADVQPLARLVSDAGAQPRLTALIFALFAGAALVLAVVGVYGIVAYGVAQQTREVGVRLALGARPGAILAGVIGRGARLAATGVALGGALALVLSRSLSALLFGVATTDPLTYVAVAVVLLAAAVAASAIPAAVAARLDPVRALRDS